MSAQGRVFAALWAAFIVQVAGRLLDLEWHRTHPAFETAQDQLTAHWLVWLGTLLVVATAVAAHPGGPKTVETTERWLPSSLRTRSGDHGIKDEHQDFDRTFPKDESVGSS